MHIQNKGNTTPVKKDGDDENVTRNFSPNILTTDQNQNITNEENVFDKISRDVANITLQSSDDSSSSEDEDEVNDEDLIAKCPDRNNDLNKNKSRELAHPYYDKKASRLIHGCGGGVILDGSVQPFLNHDEQLKYSHYNIQVGSQIPKPVQELSDGIACDDNLPDLDKITAQFITELNDKERNMVDQAIDALQRESYNKTNNIKSPLPPELNLDFYSGRMPSPDFNYTEQCVRSVDSTYGTMSSPESHTEDIAFALRSPAIAANPTHRRSTDSDSLLSSGSPPSEWPYAGSFQQDNPGAQFDYTTEIDSDFFHLKPVENANLERVQPEQNKCLPIEGFNPFRNIGPSEGSTPGMVSIAPPDLGVRAKTRMVNIPVPIPTVAIPPVPAPCAPVPPPPPPPQRFPSSFSNKLLNIKPGGVAVSELDMDKSGLERIKLGLHHSRLQYTWTKLLLLGDKVFEVDDRGQTSLITALKSLPTSPRFLEEIHCLLTLIERGKRRDYLKMKDANNHSALYIAALQCYEKPLVARCIVEVLVSLGEDPDEVYGEDEKSLLHVICQFGDSRAGLLAELLNAKRPDGRKCFDVNRTNLRGETPLHIAVQTHNTACSSLTIARILINHGASIKIQDRTNHATPLIVAVQGNCDPAMVRILLTSTYILIPDVVNIKDRQYNTALHHIASNNIITLNKQVLVINELMNHGASHNCHNASGKLPLSLVHESRKEVIRSILHRGNGKS